ncbi:bilirubin utilization transcriptional regulator BilQ [Anaerorhabdus sp.]|uniref:bilirubin utilization transcriptional regulator BilQ n=1 Tax=Anaerorhabdus sp. TaxID=1872524 RepID=UPI002FC92577
MKKDLVFYMTKLRISFMDYYKAKLEEIGISKGQQYFILAIGASKKCSPNKVSQLAQMDAGHTTRYINKLVDTGFVSKTPNPNDGRSCFLELTAKGIVAYEKSRNIFQEWTKDKMNHLTKGESVELFRLLGKLFDEKEDGKNG